MTTRYEARIRNNGESIYAYIVRIESDNAESVVNDYKGRHFSSVKAAEKSTGRYLASL